MAALAMSSRSNIAGGTALRKAGGEVSISRPKLICSRPELDVSGEAGGDYEGPGVRTEVRRVWRVLGEPKVEPGGRPWSRLDLIFTRYPLVNGGAVGIPRH